VLLAWISLSVEITVYAAELNVVLARRLWPRSIVQPPLTEADRAVLAAQALQNQRRDEQRVHVSYEDMPPRAAAGFPRTPDEITHPHRPTGTARSANVAPADLAQEPRRRHSAPAVPWLRGQGSATAAHAASAATDPDRRGVTSRALGPLNWTAPQRSGAALGFP
jgi:hypothetical protein